MTRSLISALLLGLCLAFPARAIETITTADPSGTYITTAPNPPNWNTDWPTPGTTGSDYVGQVNGSGAVYLGNGWVLTAGHVAPMTTSSPLTFLLDGNTYTSATGTVTSIITSTGTVDLSLFQISAPPSLASLKLTLNAPAYFANTNSASQVVMLGYGGSSPDQSWGENTADFEQQIAVTTGGISYVSNDIITVLGTVSNGSTLSTNTAYVVGGDSGGGDFIFDPTNNTWTLAGINEVDGTDTLSGSTVQISGMVQLSDYATQIQDITGIEVVPEPSTWALLGLGLVFLWRRSRLRR